MYRTASPDVYCGQKVSAFLRDGLKTPKFLVVTPDPDPLFLQVLSCQELGTETAMCSVFYTIWGQEIGQYRDVGPAELLYVHYIYLAKIKQVRLP